ncbi:MAG: hypothetical protein U0800_00900 [Isosphaeraceae bacterium]
MKRTFAAVALLAALGMLVKLAFKGDPPRPIEALPPSAALAAPGAPDARPGILARYPDDRALVSRVLLRPTGTMRP